MAIFFIASDLDSPNLGAKIAELYPEDYHVVSSRGWLVSAEKLTNELADQLEVKSGKYGLLLIAKVEASAGFHKKSIWEWIALKEAKK